MKQSGVGPERQAPGPVYPTIGANPVTEKFQSGNDQDADPAFDGDIAKRRRRAAYRASHRGTKEMDWLIGRFADAHLDSVEGEALTHFERFLELADPELQRWLLEPQVAPAGEFAELVRAVRAFHGLPSAPK